MKIFLAILLLNTNIVFHTPQATSDILWTEEPLTWDDFQGRPDLRSTHEASTHYQITIEPVVIGDTLKIAVLCRFDPLKSWVKPGSKSTALLQHEQLHFDLAEVHARQLRERFIRKTFRWSTLQNELDQTFTEVFTALEKEQALYDKETNHGRHMANQENWNKKVNNQLGKSKEYEATEVIKRVVLE